MSSSEDDVVSIGSEDTEDDEPHDPADDFYEDEETGEKVQPDAVFKPGEEAVAAEFEAILALLRRGKTRGTEVKTLAAPKVKRPRAMAAAGEETEKKAPPKKKPRTKQPTKSAAPPAAAAPPRPKKKPIAAARTARKSGSEGLGSPRPPSSSEMKTKVVGKETPKKM